MKRRSLLAALLALALLFSGVLPEGLAVALAASKKPNVYIVTWDNRTVKSGKAFAESDNGQLYTAPLTIYYENVTSLQVRLINSKKKVVDNQEEIWIVSGSGSRKWSCSIPAWSEPGNYRVVVDAYQNKKVTSFTFTWKVTKYVYSAYPSSQMQAKINYLQTMLPQGKFWNHGVKGTQTVYLNNGTKTTISSSQCNKWSHKKENFRDSSATCNYFPGGYQCHGFALLLGEYVWGVNPSRKNPVYDKNAVETLEPGDIVRYLNDQHTIFVLKVEKEKVYFADCNWGQTCRIRWNGSISLSQLKKTFSYVYKYSKR